MNLCFDECMAPKWFRQLAIFFEKRKSPIRAVHLLDQLRQGAKDDAVIDWLIGQSPPIMVISGDSGKKTKRGDPRMHLLCPQNKITSVFIAPKLCQKDGFEKVRMMMVCVPELGKAYNGPKGARYRLETSGQFYRVKEWPLQTRFSFPIAASQPYVQSQLFPP